MDSNSLASTGSTIANSLSSALGYSTGIDTASLVSSLVSAARTARETPVSSLVSTNNARISALASAKSSLSTFSTALTELLKTSGYSGEPASNDTSIASVSLLSGGTPTGLPAQLEVKALASAQVLQSTALTDGAALAGTGTLDLTVNGTTTAITLAEPSTSLADLASAINNANTGVTASVVTDKSGARLVLKGATGEDNAFTLTAGAGADANLQRFVYNGADTATMTRAQTATNAEISIDNVDMEFDSNEVTTAIPYLRIDLNKAAPGTKVTLATNQPTSTMSELVQDFVANYNTLRSALNAATSAPTGDTTDSVGTSGTLSSDNGIRTMKTMLSKLTTTQLTTDGTYKTLSDLGVSTNRDGTLAIDTEKLEAAIADDPEGVVQMLNPTVSDDDHPGLAGALAEVTDYLNADDGPLAVSANVYDKLKTSLQSKLDKIDEDMTAYEEQLNTSYSKLQTKLLQFKATQSYLTAQIDAWNSN